MGGSAFGAVLLAMVAATPARADGGHVGFVKLPNNQELYVQYQPAAPGRPTLVMLNGLTHDVRNWQRVIHGLQGNGYGLLAYDMRGQGQTLLKYAPITGPIPYQQQLIDLDLLLKTLGIHDKVWLTGLSYGGGLAGAFAATYPGWVRGLILMAPYTQPMGGQDTLIKQQIQMYRWMYPTLSYDELYDQFLHANVYATYPAVEPTILENPYKLEAVFRMAQGIRHMVLNQAAFAKFPPGAVHLVMAGHDQYIPADVLDEFWDSLPPAVRASKMTVVESEHKLVDVVPNFVAAWIDHILKGDPRLSGGVEFTGSVLMGDAHAGNVHIQMPRF